MHRIKQGLRLPIAGEPEQAIEPGAGGSRVGLVADDYVTLRPTMHVAEGDEVRRGQLLFEDKTVPGVRYTAPGDGRVVAINRGERRAFQSLVIEVSDADRSGRGDQVRLSSFTGRHPSALGRDAVRELLLESGLWTALRARPFSRVADPMTLPHSLFVTAMDTDPLAPDVAAVIRGREADLARGLAALARLTDGSVFLCTADGFSLPIPAVEQVRHERFAGPHPAGTVGLHIHTLDPVGRGRLVWHIGYQDTMAIGSLFESGSIDVERVVSLAGPAVTRPRLVRTRIGTSTDELTRGALVQGDVRVVSGSVLSGRVAMGPVYGYLGRYHRQVSALPEWRERELLGWAGAGLNKYSTIRSYLSRWRPARRFAMTTAVNGSLRAIVPIGLYERVMPFDLPATFLLKALVTKDVERAEELGCLELDEEDLALCTFVCAGKNEYGPYLRDLLTTIEREG
ncbi:Na(+)-translocating NADH-quinone reductase subunit A [Luteitalea sp.]|uniref:Na(+)-translocating NADH-quinone reductase subunit A n=1 Tax=Luteitalea sp. TaxID=2004800 RepID=UPI003457896A